RHSFYHDSGLGLFYSGLTDKKNSMTMMQIVMINFAVIAIQWACLATAGRMKMFPTMVFVFCWSTVVYDPVVYWVWSSNGWLHNMSVLDYAGGSVVHVSAGVAALVLAIKVGKRQDFDQVPLVNHSPPWIYIGTALLWFGWMGFNAGSASSANERAVSARGLKFSSIASVLERLRTGYDYPWIRFVQPGFGIIYGLLAGVVCFYAARYLKKCRIDDTLDVTGVHGVGGALGMILTGIFAQYRVTSLDVSGVVTAGWVDQIWKQVPVQLAAIGAVGIWSATWSVIFISVMNQFPSLRLRASPEAELRGLDDAEVGEWSSMYLLQSEEGGTVHPTHDLESLKSE
ncbi:Rh-like protein/ammonium transporter, partial [Rhizoclosmatium globosum]